MGIFFSGHLYLVFYRPFVPECAVLSLGLETFFPLILLKIISMSLVWHFPFSVLISLKLCLLKVLQCSILFFKKKIIIHLYWAIQVFHPWHCCPHDPLYYLSFLLRLLFGLFIFYFQHDFSLGFLQQVYLDFLISLSFLLFFFWNIFISSLSCLNIIKIFWILLVWI